MTITGPNNFSVTDRIAAFGHISEYFFGHVGYFRSGRRFDLPSRGKYVITIAADDQPQSWASSGAMCSLALDENPTNAMVGAQLGRMMGLALLAFGVVGLIIHAIKTA